MRLRSPLLGFVGLLVLGTIALSLVRGDLGLADAGERTGILFLVLLGVDRFLLPLVQQLITRED